MRERISVFKQQKDWYPAYQLAGWYQDKKNMRLVAVSFAEMLNNEWRVCVWGADDHGLKFDSKDRVIVWALFMAILRQEYVNQRWLIDQGFVHV